jgi:hypothetical protein
MSVLRRLLAPLALIALVVALVAPSASSAQGLSVGFAEGLFLSKEQALQSASFEGAVETSASIVRLNVRWSNIAPTKPIAGFNASDPAAPGYEWTILDAAVRDATAHGLRVLFTVYGAPAWAEGANRPAKAEPGSWEPSANAFGEFAYALATRYSGSYADPLVGGAALPAVHYFEAWNEPNLDVYLAPQYRGGENSGPALYRSLLNRFYSAVKAVQPGATVIGGSLAPFGDEPGGARTRPVLFLRGLLCLA